MNCSSGMPPSADGVGTSTVGKTIAVGRSEEVAPGVVVTMSLGVGEAAAVSAAVALAVEVSVGVGVVVAVAEKVAVGVGVGDEVAVGDAVSVAVGRMGVRVSEGVDVGDGGRLPGAGMSSSWPIYSRLGLGSALSAISASSGTP